MLIVAAGCVFAGTWQISRLEGKVSANDDLRANAHAASAAVATVLPTTNEAAPSSRKIQYKTITATGTYDASQQVLVRQRTVNGDTGYLVLTPLRTKGAVLLVIRGFISGTSSNGGLPTVPDPPVGKVSITARVEPGETRNDHAAELGNRQVESINPRLEAAWLGTTVYAGYAELEAKQPGTGHLTAIPSPDLSNPAGGAVEPQHIAYIIQWYLFAILALAAPIAMARSETRTRDSGEVDDEKQPVDVLSPQQQRAARLADRYGRVVR
jgi:cytochrome oxidase assembly protein ShyY1